MFGESTHANYWLFKSREDILSTRNKNNNEYTTEHIIRLKNSHLAINREEEDIILRFYSKLILAFNQPEICSLPNSTLAIGLVMFRRFYVVKSIMDYDPTEISLVCLYLAAKIDEVYVSSLKFISKCDFVAKNLNIQAPLTKSRLLTLEMVVMNVIDYDLAVYEPFTSLNGIRAYSDVALSQDITEFIHKAYNEAESIIFKILTTDCSLLYSHSLISFAALLMAIERQFGGKIKLRVMDSVVGNLNISLDVDPHMNTMRNFMDIGKSHGSEEISKILQKLKHCINPGHVDYEIRDDVKKSKLLNYL